MKSQFHTLFFFLASATLSAQQDTLTVEAEIADNRRLMTVNQEIIYHNRTDAPESRIKLLNWAAAYRTRHTPLLTRTLQNRKTDLYFAKPQDLAETKDLVIKIPDRDWQILEASRENLYIPLDKPLLPGERMVISMQYSIQLPLKKFTGYGTAEDQLALKYFFIVPDSYEDRGQTPKYFKNIGENQSPGNYWSIKLHIPQGLYAESNLKETASLNFEGTLNKDPEITLLPEKSERIDARVVNRSVEVNFAYRLTPEEKQFLEFYLPLQLHFIQSKTGTLPEKILITEKFRDAEDFTGIDDVKFWKFKYKLFKDHEQTDLNYFGILSKAVVEQSLIFSRNEDHWLVNGLKTYLEIQYLKRYYPERLLLGDLPDSLNIFGLKPLKFFYLSRLKLSERYGLAYQYMLTQNLDQKIAEPYENLSNFNTSAISHFETGSLFAFIAEKMGPDNFERYVQKYLKEYSTKPLDQKTFLDGLSLASGYSSDFLERFIQHKNRVNFNLKRYRKTGDDFQVKISKNTVQQIPFKIETEEQSGEKKTFWFDTDPSAKSVVYTIPQSNAEKIIINDGYIFPEKNFRDNYLYTKGFFANTKKIRLKVFKDIPNPEYNEIYVNPRLNFNAYDKALIGLNFRNTSLFDRKFQYSLTPYFSSGTGQFAGSGGISYSVQPADRFFRSLDFGIAASNFHYDYSLTYRKFSAYAMMSFRKNPRSDIGRAVSFSYNYLEKDLDPARSSSSEYGKYNLWNIGYGYADRSVIHEKSYSAGLQWMEDFKKLSAEYFHRWEYAQDKKISFRFFGGYFLNNSAKNDLFNYGISKVSNYAFSYGLLGQSASSGLLSQQLILAEGGFKSYLGNNANQWITAVNVDAHVWRWFNIYADAGGFKNKCSPAEFIWDSGVKVKVVPDFLEVYFPVQSSLGFEPSFKDYGRRIRFTLVLNFSAVTAYLRRGWF